MPAASGIVGLFSGAAVGLDERRRGGARALDVVRSTFHEMAPPIARSELECLRQSFVPSGPASALDVNGDD